MRPYRLSMKHKEFVEQEIQSMLAKGIIRPSTSPYNSAIVVTSKANGIFRFCNEFRRLNDQTIKDANSLPRNDEIMNYLHGSNFLSTIDLASGFWKLKIREQVSRKTSFSSHIGNF